MVGHTLRDACHSSSHNVLLHTCYQLKSYNVENYEPLHQIDIVNLSDIKNTVCLPDITAVYVVHEGAPYII